MDNEVLSLIISDGIVGPKTGPVYRLPLNGLYNFFFIDRPSIL
jgi:hypothetical protein